MQKQNMAPEAFPSYAAFFQATMALAQEYGDVPAQNVLDSVAKVAAVTNPYMQNRRVKAISSLPVDYGKDEIAQMLVQPDQNELPLRQASHALEWSAYPYRKIRTTYQALNTYRYYAYAPYLEEKDADSQEYFRESVLVDKLNHTLSPDVWAHQITGQAIQEGKVAYVTRIHADKSHNQIPYAFLQQLPSDWWKIVGFNNVSKYTVMFNLMYFLQPGTDYRQFGDLFSPFMDDFAGIFSMNPTADSGRGGVTNVVYATRNSVTNAAGQRMFVDMEKVRNLQANAPGKPQVYNQNGRWAYWVTLPAERCWVFEVDDATRTVASPLTGLFLAMDQIAAYESVQMEIVQNPLISVALGEIPYMSNSTPDAMDAYQLSGAGRRLFLSYWYEMLAAANTSGIGAYFAPVQNLHLETLAEAPNATNISTKGYSYAVEKSGLSGLIPITDAPRAGAVNISAALEERYCWCIYRQMEAMMETIYRGLRLKYEWRFHMFGGFSTDEKLEKTALQGLQNGILSELYPYLALKGRSALEDLSMSRAVNASGILDLRLPLVTSYTMKQDTSNLPPQNKNGGTQNYTPPQAGPGRPGKELEGGDSSEAAEALEDDLDAE